MHSYNAMAEKKSVLGFETIQKQNNSEIPLIYISISTSITEYKHKQLEHLTFDTGHGSETFIPVTWRTMRC